MAAPNIKVNEVALDNGTWRRCVGNLVITQDEAGKIETAAIEFTLEGDTAEELDSRYATTKAAFSLKNARVKGWFEGSDGTPVFDWHTTDGLHPEVLCIMTMLPEESHTARKIHCVFTATAITELDLSPGNSNLIGGEAVEGMATTIEVVKLYMDSRRYTITASGAFKASLNADQQTKTLNSVSDNGGLARFTLASGYTGTFEAGMFIDVSAPSAYAGRHFVTAFSGGNAIIDTTTPFGSAEGALGATAKLGETTSAEENWEAARAHILETLLETGPDGEPNEAEPHMYLTQETVATSSDNAGFLEFVLGSAPQGMLAAGVTEQSKRAGVGLNYVVNYAVPESWQTQYAPAPVACEVVGGISIIQEARDEKAALAWFNDDIKPGLLAEVESVASTQYGAGFREVSAEVSVDYTTNDVRFTITCLTNYTGTRAFQRTESIFDKAARTAFVDTDGFHHIQDSPYPIERQKVVRIDWTGDQGGGPSDPATPVESSFTYKFDASTVSLEESIEDEEGNVYSHIVKDFSFTRYKPRSGGGGGFFLAPGGNEGGGSFLGVPTP